MGFPQIHMKSKAAQSSLKQKLFFLGTFVSFLLLFVVRSSLSSTSSQSQSPTATVGTEEKTASAGEEIQTAAECPPVAVASPGCAKISPSLAQALTHYATSNVTPQQTLSEISVTSRVLEKKSPCNFLVFGLGHDSLMWAALNHGGRTVFLEEDRAWIEQVTSRFPSLEAHHVSYDSRVSEAAGLMEEGRREECREVGEPRLSRCRLAQTLRSVPMEVYEVEWDLIMVDAPTGYIQEAPGRMGAIYTAGMMARSRKEGETDVFVHDVDREVEDSFSKEFLCEGYMKEQEGRLRHFLIPSHRPDSTTPFCPSAQ